jgi:formylglycine-generating enzyme required for sulfatase activity
VEQIDLDALKIETPLLPFEPEIIFIPAGPFFMGSDTGQANEASLHEVKLPAYKIGKYPVTNAQYAEFLKRAYKPEYVPKRADWFLDDPPPDKLDHPVVGLSWQTAKAYCNWLTGETRQARIYRLPSEAEWEKAARGIEGQIYPWGNEWAAGRCNHTGEGTTPVGVYHEGASPYGCFDMIGNIQEWTSTLWGSSENDERFPYPYHRDDGREDLNPGRHLQQVYRIHRGGSYKDKIADLRCSARSCSNQKTEVPWRGFRVVLEV